MKAETANSRVALLTDTVSPAPLLGMPGSLGRAAKFLGEVLVLVGIVWCIPLVTIAVGLPIVLAIRIVLWVGGML